MKNIALVVLVLLVIYLYLQNKAAKKLIVALANEMQGRENEERISLAKKLGNTTGATGV